MAPLQALHEQKVKTHSLCTGLAMLNPRKKSRSRRRL
jgi:hypothetical protein